jgi:hypothetical protein
VEWKAKKKIKNESKNAQNTKDFIPKLEFEKLVFSL